MASVVKELMQEQKADILSCHVCKGIHYHTNQNEPPSGKYTNAIEGISPNCCYIVTYPKSVPKPFL